MSNDPDQPIYLIRIVYKSGNSYQTWYSKFDVKTVKSHNRFSGSKSSTTYETEAFEGPEGYAQPTFISLGASEIESIWRLDVKPAREVYALMQEALDKNDANLR